MQMQPPLSPQDTQEPVPAPDGETLPQGQTKGNRVNWIFATTLATFHLAAMAAFFCFRWSALIAFVVVWVLAQNVGIGMGYHRLLTHRFPYAVYYKMQAEGQVVVYRVLDCRQHPAKTKRALRPG